LPELKFGEEMKTCIDTGGEQDNETLEAVDKEWRLKFYSTTYSIKSISKQSK
jgi:hypothetical protein